MKRIFFLLVIGSAIVSLQGQLRIPGIPVEPEGPKGPQIPKKVAGEIPITFEEIEKKIMELEGKVVGNIVAARLLSNQKRALADATKIKAIEESLKKYAQEIEKDAFGAKRLLEYSQNVPSDLQKRQKLVKVVAQIEKDAEEAKKLAQ